MALFDKKASEQSELCSDVVETERIARRSAPARTRASNSPADCLISLRETALSILSVYSKKKWGNAKAFPDFLVETERIELLTS